MRAAVFPFAQGGPLMHAVAAKAVAFAEASAPEFRAARALLEHWIASQQPRSASIKI